MEKVLGIITYILTFYIEYFCILKLTKSEKNITLKNNLIIISLSLVNYFCTPTEIILFKCVVSFATIFIMLRAIIGLDVGKSLIASIILYVFLVLEEFVFSIILVDVLKYNPSKYILSLGAQKLIISLIMSFTLYLICCIKLLNKLYNMTYIILNKIGIKTQYFYYFILSVMILITIYSVNVIGKLQLFYNIIYIFIFIIFLIYLFLSLHRYYYLKMFNEILQEKDDNYQKIIDEYRMFKHNIKNELMIISSLGNNKVKGVINEYLNEFNTDMVDDIDHSNIPNGLKGLLYQKLIKANKTNCKVYVDNFISVDPINKLALKTYTRFFHSIGIILDNALEEIDIKDPNSYIYLYLNESNKYYEFKCANTFSKNIDVDNLFVKGKSSKVNHMGMGTYYILNKSNLDFSVTIKNNLFIANLIVKK